ncbi:hypothetical protein Hdeb2414_s0001g00004701 [Helianthus debilis subsp. tardiflorus]
MTDSHPTTPDTSPKQATSPKPLHPVYSVTNINTKVRTLDGEKVTYSNWVKLFRLHAHGYDVLSHIDGTEPPGKTDPAYESWSKIDSIVLQWIYNTLSDSYVKRIIDILSKPGCTAQQAWDRLHTVFLNNKNARAATLEHAFTNTTMVSCSSLNDYFQRMKDLADQLSDVDHSVSESRLVLQMVSGLPQEYDIVASFITQAEKSWDDARDMIEREQRRQATRQSIQAAFHPTSAPSNPQPNPPANPTHNPNPHPPQPYHPAQTYDQRAQYPTRGRGRGRHSYRGRGRYSNYQTHQPTNHSTQQPYSPSYSPYPWWASPPPCPYPAQSPWTSNWNRTAQTTPPHQPAHPSQPPAGYGLTAPTTPSPYCPPPGFPFPPGNPTPPPIDPMQPTELGTALSALTLTQPMPQWNMDTGASSHITSDPGSQD